MTRRTRNARADPERFPRSSRPRPLPQAGKRSRTTRTDRLPRTFRGQTGYSKFYPSRGEGLRVRATSHGRRRRHERERAQRSSLPSSTSAAAAIFCTSCHVSSRYAAAADVHPRGAPNIIAGLEPQIGTSHHVHTPAPPRSKSESSSSRASSSELEDPRLPSSDPLPQRGESYDWHDSPLRGWSSTPNVWSDVSDADASPRTAGRRSVGDASDVRRHLGAELVATVASASPASSSPPRCLTARFAPPPSVVGDRD